MWILKKKWNQMEKRVDDLENQNQLSFNPEEAGELFKKVIQRHQRVDTCITERVVNIKELENYIETAHLSLVSLMQGIETGDLSDVEEIVASLKKVDRVLEKAYQFEFEVERRATICK